MPHLAPRLCFLWQNILSEHTCCSYSTLHVLACLELWFFKCSDFRTIEEKKIFTCECPIL